MKYSKIKEIKIPDETIKKWQDIVDTIADLLEIPAVLIMKANPPYIEVLSASETADNPYHAGDREKLAGLFCEEIILNNEKLLIPNALKDKKWKNSPDIKLGMISYLGFPIKWPDGDLFGVLCILDSKENNYSIRIENLLKEFSSLIEIYLSLIYNNKELVEKENKLDITLQSIGDGVIITTAEGIITRMNNIAEKLTGWDQDKAVGEKIAKVFKVVDVKTKRAVRIPLQRVLKTGQIVGFKTDVTLKSKDGTKRQIADSLAPIKDNEGNIVGIILVFSDITDKYQVIQNLKKSEKRYRILFNTMLEGCQVINFDWEYVYINNAFLKQINLAEKKLIGNKIWEVFPGIEETDMFSLIKECMADRSVKEIKSKFKFTEGEEKSLHLRIYPVSEGVFVLSNDITERVKAINELKNENTWLKALYENSNDPIVTVDKKNNIINVNDAFEELFKYSFKEIEGSKLDQIMSGRNDNSVDEKYTSDLLEKRVMGKEDTLYDKEGNAVECIIKKVPVIVDRKVIGAYVIYDDISLRKKREKDILYIGYHDGLTGLNNRVFLEAEIASLEANRVFPICILMLDLNGLKLINDSYGHRIGDKLLIRTAEVLKNIFREEDIIVRWGGDEFVILLTDTSDTIIESLIKRIKNINQNVEVENGNQIPLSLAVGWSVKKDESTEIDDLLQEAENMMYKDKLLENKSMKSHLVETLLSTLKQKSQETTEHAKRMSSLAIKLGESIGLPETELSRLSLIAVLHDIGKTVIPEKILNKVGQLTEEEWEIIKEHPATGYRICSEVDEFSHVANEVLAHHEYWNGKGYPQGLKGKEIPILSRIITIVDAYDVMTNDRTYSKAISKKDAIEELKRCAGTQFDPLLVKEFAIISE